MTPITLKKILAALPLPATGVTLAFAALGLLFQNCFCNLLPSPPAAAILYAVCGTIAAGIWLLLILKILFCFPEIREAMRNPLSASVSGTFPMATMLLAVYLEPLASGAAAVLWFAAVGLHAALIIFFTVRFMFPPKLGQIFPSCLIVYVGITAAAITAPCVNQLFIGQLAFWFGLLTVVPLVLAVIVRYAKIPVPEPARPLFCIFTAPAAICLAGYIQCFTPQTEIVAAALAAETAVLIFVLSRLPGLLRLTFYPTYAAFTFPFVITATATLLAVCALRQAGISSPLLFALAGAEILLSAVLVSYVAVRYVKTVAKLAG